MTPNAVHFSCFLKAWRKGMQPLDFHYHDGTTSSAQHIHHWWVIWCKAAISQLWSCYRRKDRALLKDAMCFRSTSAGCAMSGDSSKCFYALFEGVPAALCPKWCFLEHNNAHPEDHGLCSEGHRDLVLPDHPEHGTCLGHKGICAE